jgi:uncharacterized membrane protein
MKFVVGVMLTSFGLFWGSQGAGVHWPGDDAALLVLVPGIALYAVLLVAYFRRARKAGPGTGPDGTAAAATGQETAA